MHTIFRHPSMLAISVSMTIYAPHVVANSGLTVLEQTTTQAQQHTDTLVIERSEIQNAVIANTDLAQLLKTQPGIAINDGQSSLRGGDLLPEAISLADARPHETNYMVGGVTTNNITTYETTDKAGGLTGHTSGYTFDTDLLESVEIMDSNVGAEFGGFTGGVINAELRKPTQDFTLEYRFRMTDSDWNSDPKVDSDYTDFELANQGDGRYQPNYQKRFHNLFVGGEVASGHLMGFGLSIKESDIPLYANGIKQNTGQSNYSAFINHLWQQNEWHFANELRFSEYKEDRFLNDGLTKIEGMNAAANSRYTNNHSGMGLTVKADRQFSWGEWQNTLAFDQLKDGRRADVNYYHTFFNMETVEFSTLGSYGNLDQIQHSAQLKSLVNLNPWYTGEVRHQITAGVELQNHRAKGEFLEDYHSFSQFYYSGGTGKRNSWTIYEAGTYKADTHQVALFATNNMQWRNLDLSIGFRAERMDLFSETVFAPRITAAWNFETDYLNRVTLGSNRYYSGSLLGYAITSERNGLKSNRTNCTNADNDYSSLNPNDYSCDEATYYESYDLSLADTPYADELSAKWDVQFGNWELNTSYVRRDQRKGLSYNYSSTTNIAAVTNTVTSSSNIYTARFGNIQPYQVLGGQWHAYVDLGYIDRKGSGSIGSVYDSGNDLYESFTDQWVVLDGELMRMSDMNTGSYNSSVTAALGFDARWQQYGVTWSNLVNYEGGRDMNLYVNLSGTGTTPDGDELTGLRNMVSAELDSLLTWDTKISWTPAVLNHHASFDVSVTNVLNNKQKIASNGIVTSNPTFTHDYYNKGREVWFSLGYKW